MGSDRDGISGSGNSLAAETPAGSVGQQPQGNYSGQGNSTRRARNSLAICEPIVKLQPRVIVEPRAKAAKPVKTSRIEPRQSMKTVNAIGAPQKDDNGDHLCEEQQLETPLEVQPLQKNQLAILTAVSPAQPTMSNLVVHEEDMVGKQAPSIEGCGKTGVMSQDDIAANETKASMEHATGNIESSISHHDSKIIAVASVSPLEQGDQTLDKSAVLVPRTVRGRGQHGMVAQEKCRRCVLLPWRLVKTGLMMMTTLDEYRRGGDQNGGVQFHSVRGHGSPSRGVLNRGNPSPSDPGHAAQVATVQISTTVQITAIQVTEAI